MRNFRAAAIAAATMLVLALPASALAATPKHYYLSLGDSLSVGWQPTAAHPLGTYTNTGYADDLEKLIASRHLTLEKLGCPGETTTSMTKGGICKYKGATNQLAAAVKFIKTHKVSLITIDIGANDVDGCAKAPNIVTCALAGSQKIGKNVPGILKALRKAAGSATEIAGMTYYDPFLQFDLSTSATQQSLATASVPLAQDVNNNLITLYEAQNVKVADVATAFGTYLPFSQTTTLAPYGTIPTAVADICNLTWMCNGPAGPNIHANNTGYQLIAQTFKSVI